MDIISIIYKVSDKVKRYSDIAHAAEEMKDMLEAKNFKGLHHAGYALAHAQVCENPFAFFVVDNFLITEMTDDFFESAVIVNPMILEAPVYSYEIDPIAKTAKVNSAEYEEGCLSFPHRRAKHVLRYNRIKVRYWYKRTGWLSFLPMRRRTRWLEGLQSQVFQHEFDHTEGKNVFFEGLKD